MPKGIFILDEFDREVDTLGALKGEVGRLLEQLLAGGPIRIHSMESRVKERASLERKLSKNSGRYLQLSDVTDVCGARIITYFEDQVDAVATVIEREFKIDWPNSIDKRKAAEPDRFGYASLHYVASLDEARAALTENKRFLERKFEIQIRSILQHAWAEIEHDLQYKSEAAVPYNIRRRFARLAGLLELADSEFTEIRKVTDDYRLRMIETMKTSPADTGIDFISLGVFIRERQIVRETDAAISVATKIPVSKEDTPNLDILISTASALSINTIQELENQLSQNTASVVSFAKEFLTRDSAYMRSFPVLGSLGSGISIGYLFYLLLARLGSVEATKAALGRVKYPVTSPDIDQLSQELQAVLQSTEGNASP